MPPGPILFQSEDKNENIQSLSPIHSPSQTLFRNLPQPSTFQLNISIDTQARTSLTVSFLPDDNSMVSPQIISNSTANSKKTAKPQRLLSPILTRRRVKLQTIQSDSDSDSSITRTVRFTPK